MRRQPAFFGDRELNLIYIAKRLRDALRLEEALTEAGIDYAVETDAYRGGMIFVSERVGAFFYVDDRVLDAAHEIMRQSGFQPWRPF
ncbi:MAG TPA: hypothetical protein VFA28_03805 [Bryobacteraceae bacterium]|jgi:hypothetical protein|nr:hypothetical protein [Bryobacteraceae bacterium]